MKRMFAPTWLSAWLAGFLPDSAFFMAKKTPWYRRSWMSNAPWIAPVLIAPFAAFLLWKAGSRLMHRETQTES